MRAACHAPIRGDFAGLRGLEWDKMLHCPAQAARAIPYISAATSMSQTRHVFFISDGTGITAETLGHSLLAQFPDTRFRNHRLPFIDSTDKARDCVQRIKDAAIESGIRPIVFNTLVDPDAVAGLREADALFLDLFEKFIEPLENELGQRSTHAAGRFHGIAESQDYKRRIEAINFTLAHDDGISLRNLDQAQVILLGVSRCGKTPTSLYLALQFGVYAVNYPFIADDMDNLVLPASLKPLQHKLFGLTIDPERLAAIREERRENSRYASLRQCRMEVAEVEALYRKNQIPWLNSTNYSVEEIATKILDIMGLNRRMY